MNKINKTITGVTDNTKKAFKFFHDTYGQTLRVTNLPVLLASIYGLRNFELFDSKEWNSGYITGHLIDLQIEFRDGKEIDFDQLVEDLQEKYHFTKNEQIMFLQEPLWEKLLGLFLALIYPEKEEIQ